MKALSILDEVVLELEQDVNISRIKRIVFFACKEFWENDAEQLEGKNLGSLIEELCAKYSRLEDIEVVLNNIVAKVNKKTEYALVADQVICQLSRLYEYQDFTKLETNISNFGGPQAPDFQEEFSSQLPVEESNARDPGNLFDVRQKILQQTNPLRAKILIFSTLYHEFTFSDRDWLLLKNQELDNLLRQLFNVCPTLAELETQLYKTAKNLDNTDESDQAASVIIKAMNSCYVKQQQEERDRAEDSISQDYDQTHLVKNIYEESKSSGERTDYFEAGDITRIIQATPPHYHYDPLKSYLVPGGVEIIPLKQPETSSNSSTEDVKQVLPETSQVEETPTIVEIYDRRTAATKNISDSIKQKLGLEEEIRLLMTQNVNQATAQIENIFSELESALNKQFSTESSEDRLYWKYKTLRDYVRKVQGFTGKLMEILNELESKESGRLTPETPDNISGDISKTDSSNSTSKKPTQQQLVNMAKQGNSKAIAVLINQLLEPKGITATAGFKDDWLHVILESTQIQNQQDTAIYIHKKLCTLKSKSLKNVKIHGRQPGNKTVAWTQEFVNQTN
jgi:molybdopterin converting factor small subunit